MMISIKLFNKKSKNFGLKCQQRIWWNSFGSHELANDKKFSKVFFTIDSMTQYMLSSLRIFSWNHKNIWLQEKSFATKQQKETNS